MGIFSNFRLQIHFYSEFGTHYLRGTRKLYLSGSPFENIKQLKDFYSLETLELCAANLEELPADFSRMMPNLVNLYLSMNRLLDIRPLKRLKYLERLVLLDNRLMSINEVISVVKQLKRLTVLDLRFVLSLRLFLENRAF